MAKVIICGERFGRIRDAFIQNGHYALSCDRAPSEAPGPHYTGDWWDMLFGNDWDLAIFHPTCTYMANSGAKHLFRNMSKNGGLNWERWVKMGEAAWDVWDITERCTAPYIAIENPVMLRYAQIMSGLEKWPCQTVQPWWFADSEDGPDNVKKATCWWTKGGLPKLTKTGTLDGSTARDEVFKMAPTSDPEVRRMERSKFHPGHAAAIAQQWGDYVNEQLALKAA